MCTLPLRIESCANLREHWAQRAKRAKLHRMSAACAVAKGLSIPDGPFTVRLVRVGKRALDTDNLAGGFKAVRDGVADALAMNDNDKRITWEYEQEHGAEYACRIEILAAARGLGLIKEIT